MNRAASAVLAGLGLGAVGGAGYLVYRAMRDRALRDYGPDVPAALGSGSTGYKRVDALLPRLRQIAQSTGIPLGLMVAWIAKESGGKLSDRTSLDERGYYQLMPAESKSLGLDHERLSTDSDYSLDAGTKLIRKYQSTVNDLFLDSAPVGSSFYWSLVKLAHTVGSGQTRKWVKAAKAAGRAGSWDDFKSFVLGETWTGPQPKKWMPFMDEIRRMARPFGFGTDSAAMVAGFGPGGCVVLPVDPADREALARAVESCRARGSIAEKQAVAWACRNRARRMGLPVAEVLAPGGEYGPRGEGGREFVSTEMRPGPESTAVAACVLGLPEDADPTRGAVDFWVPSHQGRLLALGGTTVGEREARAALEASGLAVVGIVGDVELLCAVD